MGRGSTGWTDDGLDVQEVVKKADLRMPLGLALSNRTNGQGTHRAPQAEGSRLSLGEGHGDALSPSSPCKNAPPATSSSSQCS